MIATELPRVAIVTPAYNAGRFLLETIESVQRQTLTNHEYIIIDDGSTDGTPDIARSVQDSRIEVHTISNSGVSFARNEGLKRCRAPYILFLDADDVLRPDALERMVEALETHHQFPACFAHHVKVHETCRPTDQDTHQPLRVLPSGNTLWHLLAKNIIVNGGALCLRTEAARAIGGFKTNLKLGEDWEFWCRLAFLGDFLPLQNLVAVNYRQTSSGGNRQQRGPLLRPNFSAVDAIYDNPDLESKFSAHQLLKRKRKAKLDSYWSSAKAELTHGSYGRFASYMLVGGLLYPDSLLQPRLIYRFLSSSLGQRRRPKISDKEEIK